MTIAENPRRFDFLSRNPSLNDKGQVSFAARLDAGGEAILRGRGGPRQVIARTDPGPFNFFGFDTSLNNEGRVAFKAELDEEFDFDEGLFSSRGAAIATHYRASSSRFDGTDTRPSINDSGNIAFTDSVRFDPGVFVTSGLGFAPSRHPTPRSRWVSRCSTTWASWRSSGPSSTATSS